MSTLIRSLLIVLARIGSASLLNPSAEKHRQRVKVAVAERNQLAALLRLGELTAIASSYHSQGFASYTKANDKLLSVGAFGVVVFVESTK